MQRKCRPGFLTLLLLMIVSAFVHIVVAQAAPRRIEVTARQFAFAPGEITLKKGQPVVLVLKSQDVGHGLRIGRIEPRRQGKRARHHRSAFYTSKDW